MGNLPRTPSGSVITNEKPASPLENEQAHEVSVAGAVAMRSNADFADLITLQHEIVENQLIIEGVAGSTGKPRIPERLELFGEFSKYAVGRKILAHFHSLTHQSLTLAHQRPGGTKSAGVRRLQQRGAERFI